MFGQLIIGAPFHPTYNDRYKGTHLVGRMVFDPIWNMKSLDIFLFHYSKRGMKHKSMAAITDWSTCWLCFGYLGFLDFFTV